MTYHNGTSERVWLALRGRWVTLAEIAAEVEGHPKTIKSAVRWLYIEGYAKRRVVRRRGRKRVEYGRGVS